MDPVRFGRVLGFGARSAAKTAVKAAAAATAPNPATRTVTAGQAQPMRTTAAPEVSPRNTAERARLVAIDGKRTAKGLREGTRRFGREVWKPTVRLSGVLALEVAGVFFGIFALFALTAAVRLRSAWVATATNGPEHKRLLGALAMLAVFGYFCVSSFVRAGRRARRR